MGIVFRIEKKELVFKLRSTVAGARGESLYDIAVRNGYTGTEEEFIESFYVNLEQTTGNSTSDGMSQKAITDNLNLKINKDQGVANAGKVLTVGQNGIVTPQDLPEPTPTPTPPPTPTTPTIIVMSRSEYDRLPVKQRDVLYGTYEDEEPASEESIDLSNHTLNVTSISGNTMESSGEIVGNTLVLGDGGGDEPSEEGIDTETNTLVVDSIDDNTAVTLGTIENNQLNL